MGASDGDEARYPDKAPMVARRSQELVDEEMKQLENPMQQIDEGELYLHADGYEDDSAGH